jgi:hypothetical protein
MLDQPQVLLNHVLLVVDSYAFSQKEAARRLTQCTVGEANPPRRAREQSDRRGFQQSLKIHCDIEPLRSQTLDRRANCRSRFGVRPATAPTLTVDLDESIEARILSQQRRRSAALRHPGHIACRLMASNQRKRRQRVHHIANRPEFDNQNSHCVFNVSFRAESFLITQLTASSTSLAT